MKKILSGVVLLATALTLSGCIAGAETGVPAGNSLVKVRSTAKQVSLAGALNNNQKALAFADSEIGAHDLDSFVLAMGEAQIEENYAAQYEAQFLARLKAELAQNPGASGNTAASDTVMTTAVASYNSVLSGTLNTLTSLSSGTSSSTTSSSPASSGGSSSSGSSSSGSGSSSGSSGTTEDPDYALLSLLFDDFQQYQENMQPYFDAAEQDPAGGIGAPDADLVGLYYAADSIIQFVQQHPQVKDGDMVLADVGDTMVLTDRYWGLGGVQAEAAYTYILLYYPAGSYAAYAEEQLSLLTE